MARFSAIPPIPLQATSSWEYNTLNSIKENVELLTGTRGEQDGASRALTKSSITVNYPPAQTMTQVTAQGTAVSIEGAVVPDITDYYELIKNVQQLANDVAGLRNTLNTLIAQLRG